MASNTSAVKSPEYAKAKAAIGGARFMLGVMNANAQYSETVNTARQNIALAQNNINDTLSRGREAQLARESEGIRAAGQSSLNMAAQGLDVSSGLGQDIANSYTAVGALNGARELINSYREALGYEIEQLNNQYAMGMAGSNRNMEYLNSALSLGGGLADAYL